MHFSLPAYPAGALPSVTFATTMSHKHNGDSIDLVHYDPAHTDTDIYIHFHNADVLHCGDIFFNKLYPFIDEGTGGSIGGTIDAAQKSLALAGDGTRVIPGHGPLGNKADLKTLHRHAFCGARQRGRTQESGRKRTGSDREKTDCAV